MRENAASQMGDNSILKTPKREDSLLHENKKYSENFANVTLDKRIVQFAIKVHQICQPMVFVTDGKQRINEEVMKQFFKQQFHTTISNFSFSSDTNQVEYVALKYITFMSSYRENSSLALAKLKQIKHKNLHFSFFFRQIFEVIQSTFIGIVKQRHSKQDLEGNQMQVSEIWRLENLKDEIINRVILVLRAKIKLWENLSSGETSNLDRLQADVIRVSTQVEESRSQVIEILKDFQLDVRKNYTYYHKYLCFSHLYFDANYKKAAYYQKRMEEVWQLSKAANENENGVINNFQWLQGDLVTLEVSVALHTGQIINRVTPRLVEFFGFKNNDDMQQQLKARAISLGSIAGSNNALLISSLLPPFLTTSHNYYIQRFLNRGWTPYIQDQIISFICNSERFLERVTVHLSFNFENQDDFSMLGSILKKKEEDDDYIIFDEWGRILGVSETNFNRIIVKNALREFGVVSSEVTKERRSNKIQQLKEQLMDKIAQDSNAKLFKKQISNFQRKKPDYVRRTYEKPSDILMKFGSIWHFLPSLCKQVLGLLAKEIFKQIQKENEKQFQKLANNNNHQQQYQNEKFQMISRRNSSDKFIQEEISMLPPDKQNSIQGAQAAYLLEGKQYRNFVMNNFLDENGLMRKTLQLVQDEKVMLYVPKNYNELIEFFNDAATKFQENKSDFDARSMRRWNIQSKTSYIQQEQQCYNIFDAEFNDFMDSKIKRYYSKALLKEAIEATDAKYLEMVRYKTMISIDVGVGGISDTNQFLYFVCKLSSLNLLMAKRKDVLKLHMKKDKEHKFEAGEELRKSLLHLQSQESFGGGGGDRKQFVHSNSSIEQGRPQQHQSLLISPAPSDRAQEKKLSVMEQPASEKPKPKLTLSFMKKKRNVESGENMVVSLRVPDAPAPKTSDRDDGPNLKLELNATNPKLVDSSIELSKEDSAQDYNQMKSSLSFQNSLAIPAPKSPGSAKSDDMLASEVKRKPKIGFLKKMEEAFDKNQPKKVASESDDARKQSLMSMNFAQGFFATFFSRLNLRKLTNLDNKNDVFENNPDMGFQEHSEGSEKDEKELDKVGSQTPSGSQSMSSNNFSKEDIDKDEEDLRQAEDDELKNIFEVMSQASNQQSLRSISAIAMATNISKRCLAYVPEQALTLQILKVVLVILNIAGLISLIVSQNSFIQSISVGGLDEVVLKLYEFSCISLQSSSAIELLNKAPFESASYPQQQFETAIEMAYNKSFHFEQHLVKDIATLIDAVTFPMDNDLSILKIPAQFTQPTVQEIITQQKVELDAMEIIDKRELEDAVNMQLYQNSIDLLLKRLLFQYQNSEYIATQIQHYSQEAIDEKANVAVYLMVAFICVHFIVILIIVPFIKQISNIYTRVDHFIFDHQILCILSRVTLEEVQDEIKKLTLCEHLLETEDDSWVTQNQVKLVFYNRSKQLDLHEKYRKNNNNSKKDHIFFSFRLSDSHLSIWKDMTLYIIISLISIAFLLFATFNLQDQIKNFNPIIKQYNNGLFTNSLLTSHIAKLTITPQRYFPFDGQELSLQETLYQMQLNGYLSYLLQSMKAEVDMAQKFNSDLTEFLEQLNIIDGHSDSQKIKVNQADFLERYQQIQQSTSLQKLNHLLKDNLCYYSEENICIFQEQKDFFNTGLIGAIDQIIKFYLNRESFLQQFHNMDENDHTDFKVFWTESSDVREYYQSMEYKLLSLYGQQVIHASFESFQSSLKAYLEEKKTMKNQELLAIYLGVGIPLVVLTFLLGAVEMQLLKRKVRRIILSITFLPTYKFQDKIVLALIKSILRI